MLSSPGRDTFRRLGSDFRILLRARESGDRIAVIDSASPPGYSPPQRIHHCEDETFVILTGDVKFWLEGESFVRPPGTAVSISRGKEHTFRVIGDKPSRQLIILTPGGFEGFFEEMSERAMRIPDNMSEIIANVQRFNLTFTGPPLGAETDIIRYTLS